MKQNEFLRLGGKSKDNNIQSPLQALVQAMWPWYSTDESGTPNESDVHNTEKERGVELLSK